MLIAVYGTLKRGKYNHERFGLNKSRFLGVDVVNGVKLYSCHAYPYPFAKKDAYSQNGKAHVEVFDVSQDMWEMLDNMECGAGYVSSPIRTTFGIATIWVATRLPPMCEEVEGGLWE